MDQPFINSYVNSPQYLPLNQIYNLFIGFKTPLITSAVYLFVVLVWSRLNRSSNNGLKKKNKEESNGIFLKTFIVFHNFLLMIFSLLTFYHTFSLLFNQFTSNQQFNLKLRDLNQTGWKSGIFFWGWLFYLSKYYELIDTFIILIKGRTPSILQSYHHAGAIIGMWVLIKNNAFGSWIFITFNSFIHTIMYNYYITATLGYRLPAKKYITYLQIGQFILGILIALLYIALPNCQTQAQSLSIIFNIVYVIPLIFLFYIFANQSYGRIQVKTN